MKIFTLAILLLITICGANYLQQYLSFPITLQYQSQSFTTPLWLLLLSGIVLILNLLLIYHLIYGLYTSYVINKHQWLNKRLTSSLAKLDQAFIALTTGNYKLAEKLAAAISQKQPNFLLAYLTAANAAELQQAYSRRDAYLTTALKYLPNANLAINLIKSQLQLTAKQPISSLTTIQKLEQSLTKKHELNNYKFVALQVEIYLANQQLEYLKNILPKLINLIKKINLTISERTKLEALIFQAYDSLFLQAYQHSEQQLTRLWQTIPKHFCLNAPQLTIGYIKGLITFKAYDLAEKIVRKQLLALQGQVNLRNFYLELLELYSLIYSTALNKQIIFAEKLLKVDFDNHLLLLTLAKLCLKNKLWGKAKHYLNASITISPSAQAYAALAALTEKLGETQQSESYYKQGLLTNCGSIF